jgi:hypothetical protein
MTTAPATIELPDPRRTVALRLAEGSRSIVVLGRPTETNLALVAAFAELGCRSWLADPATLPRVGSSDVVLARLDVLPTLDGIESGLWKLPQLKRAGARTSERAGRTRRCSRQALDGALPRPRGRRAARNGACS